MAIFVGGNLLTAPNIQSKICGGTAEINGSFTTDSAKQLSDSLNEGTLPAPLILMQEEKISPTLGDSALSGSLRAGMIGLIGIMILIYMMYGYKKMILTGIVLIAFLAVLAAFMKLTDYALSLSGIAVIILSIGM
jgi:preprotein translocase subunit SecD